MDNILQSNFHLSAMNFLFDYGKIIIFSIITITSIIYYFTSDLEEKFYKKIAKLESNRHEELEYFKTEIYGSLKTQMNHILDDVIEQQNEYFQELSKYITLLQDSTNSIVDENFDKIQEILKQQNQKIIILDSLIVKTIDTDILSTNSDTNSQKSISKKLKIKA